MSTAETEPVDLGDEQAIKDAADLWADRYGTEEAIQRLWKAVTHLKKRQDREERDSE